MKLHIDGKWVDAQTNQTLLDLVIQLSLFSDRLSDRPLAAKISGEVFTLNYIPVRQQEKDPDRPSIRRAMASSQGEIQLLRYTDPSGKDVYVRSAQFVLFLAVRQLWPQAKAKMNCTVGSGLYVEVESCPDFSAERLKAYVTELVKRDIPLNRRRVTTDFARNYFREQGQEDKARLLSWRTA